MKTVAVIVASVVLVSAPCIVEAQELIASLGEAVDPTQGATLEIEQARERSEEHALTFHGVGLLSYFAPFGEDPTVNLAMAQLETQWNNGTVGLYSTVRARATNLNKPLTQGYLYFQQAYGFYRHDFGDVKVGKLYGHFGRTWDYGFYGPLIANHDTKIQPDLGISAEGAPEVAEHLDLEYALQYFVADGKTLSVSNPRPFSLDGAHRRNIVVARAAPKYHFDDETYLGVGVSAQHFDAVRVQDHGVSRAALDVDVAFGALLAFAEVGRQDGVDVQVTKNLRVDPYDYVWTGLELKLEPVNVRYNFNAVRYKDGYGTVDHLHQPGIEVAMNEHVSVMGELVWWTSSHPNALHSGEKSFYLVLSGKV